MISNNLHPVPVSPRIKKEVQKNTNRSQVPGSQVSNPVSSSFNVPGNGVGLQNSSPSLRNRATIPLSSSTTSRHRSPSPHRHVERNANRVHSSVQVSRNPLNNQIATNHSQPLQNIAKDICQIVLSSSHALSYAFLFYVFTCQKGTLCKEMYPNQPPYSTVLAERNCYQIAPEFATQAYVALAICVFLQIFSVLKHVIK